MIGWVENIINRHVWLLLVQIYISPVLSCYEDENFRFCYFIIGNYWLHFILFHIHQRKIQQIQQKFKTGKLYFNSYCVSCAYTIQLRLSVKYCAILKLNWCLRKKINSSLAVVHRLWLRYHCGADATVTGRSSLIITIMNWIHFRVLSIKVYVIFCECEIKMIAKTRLRKHLVPTSHLWKKVLATLLDIVGLRGNKGLSNGPASS